MCDKEPKDALKPPFWAGSGLNTLAIQNLSELGFIKLLIGFALFKQFFMGASIGNLSVFEDHNAICG